MLRIPCTKYLSLLLLLFVVACHHAVDPQSIGEAEYYYDEKLASLSPDEDGSFWVGSETGDLIKLKDKQRISYDLGEDRIYKVLREPHTGTLSTLWLGVRNSGLQAWELRGLDTPQKRKSYPIKFKGLQYSAYDFIGLQGQLYVATSQGLYHLDKQSPQDSLTLIYPSEACLAQQNGYSFVCHNLCSYQDSLLFSSTQNGLLCLDIKSQKQSVLLEGRHIDYVSIYENQLYVLAGGKLYIGDLAGRVWQEIVVGNSPKVYYQVAGIHYLVGVQELLLSKDLQEFLSLPLRRTIPLGARNVILPGQESPFTYLLTDHALWRIANHMDIFKGNVSVKLACADESAHYYLSSENELYRQAKQGRVAKWIYSFPKDTEIAWMDIFKGTLYFHNSKEFKKLRLSTSGLKNILFHQPKTLVRSEAKITAAVVKEFNQEFYAFIGIQDGLLRLRAEKQLDTVPEFNNVYVSSIFNHPHMDRLYFSTLNDGVFYLSPEGKIKQIEGSSRYSFLKDVFATNDHHATVLMLSNHQIVSQNPADCLAVKGYNSLLYVNDSLFYGIPELGIHKFMIKQGKIQDLGLYYPDIRFRPRAVWSNMNELYLGSNLGVIHFKADQEEEVQWLRFEEPLSIHTFYAVLFACLSLLVVLLIVFSFLRRKKTRVLQLEKRKEDLVKRGKELFDYYQLVQKEEMHELNYIQSRIDKIDFKQRNHKAIHAQFDELSLALINLNREVTLLLPKKLEEQVQAIQASIGLEREDLLAASCEAAQAHDLVKMKQQITTNGVWLEQRARFLARTDALLTDLEGCLELEGLNKGLYRSLSALQKNKTKPLPSLLERLKLSEETYQKMQSKDALQAIKAYISQTKAYLVALSESCTDSLQEQLEQVSLAVESLDCLTVLRSLQVIDKQVQILKKRDELEACMQTYKENRKRVLRANEDLVNKKFDKELAILVEQANTEVVTQVEQLIDEFYGLLNQSQTEHAILSEVLKFSNFHNQQAKVLALLLADPKVKRSLIPGLLGVYGNLNPVISRLINNRIRAHEETLRSFHQASNLSVFVCWLLQFLD